MLARGPDRTAEIDAGNAHAITGRGWERGVRRKARQAGSSYVNFTPNCALSRQMTSHLRVGSPASDSENRLGH
jgi:hypothetical protein